MSSRELVNISCPSCRRESEFAVWNSINTLQNPEMKSAVRDGSAFLFHCPYCGTVSDIRYGLLYHQQEDRLMLYYADSDKAADQVRELFSDESVDNMSVDLSNQGYLVRLTRTHAHFVEKLAIFDAGLDDRAVEIVKLVIAAQIMEENNVSVQDSLFFTNDEGKHMLRFIADGNPYAIAQMDEALYNAAVNTYLYDRPDICRDDIEIDAAWAARVVGYI